MENTAHNPYITKPCTYKDALLMDVADSSNRLGVNTFQLIHRLGQHKSNDIEDDSSEKSTATENQDNTKSFKTARMRFQITLEDTTPDTFLDDLSTHINRILEVVNINTPGVKLAPWHDTTIEKNLYLFTE
jgi:hypothetical protein